MGTAEALATVLEIALPTPWRGVCPGVLAACATTVQLAELAGPEST